MNEIEPITKDCDREERYPKDVWKKACETGLVGGLIPEASGGPGFGFGMCLRL
ncbi:MAG: acyl-CoA dehydrogenase family protein [Deltaproteobacteria bacterium]|nr:acyl-CoA dehydrogenase family protein [Deltaproteobacteria bacterium]